MPLLYDHSPVKDCGTLCRDIQEQIDSGNCRIVDLLDEKNRIWQRPEIFQKEDGAWNTRQYIGLLEYQGNRVTIASRFDKGAPQPFFLWSLLENFLGESMISLENIGSSYQKGFFDELLALKLALQLQQAFQKGGLRAYRHFRRNDSKVSGVIDIPRHIRENLELDNGRMAYRTQAYSLDNHWNVLFLQAGAAVRRRFPDLIRRLERRFPEFSAALRALAQAAPGWEEVRLDQVLSRTERSIVNPIYRDWEPVRRAARAVLRRLGASPGESGSSSVTGVFLDIDRLWERLLENELFRGAEKPFSQQSFSVMNGHMEIRPDFYFPARRTVLDAKNRSAWEKTLPPVGRAECAELKKILYSRKADAQKRKWSEMIVPPDAVRDNVYQILSYMLALDCTQGGVIFPSRACREPVCDPIGPPGLDFWRIPVCIPQTEHYSDFRNRLENELLRLRTLAPVCRIVTG